MIKIRSYNLFLESLFSKTTAPYYFSKRFREIIKRLLNKSSIAEYLGYAEGNLRYKSDITFIDITDNENMISFIQVNRLEKMVPIDEDKDSFDEAFKKSVRNIWYETNGNLNHRAWTTQRTDIGVGKFLTKLFKDMTIKPTQSESEEFINMYKSTFRKMNNTDSSFEMVEGEDIRKYYLELNYENRIRGDLGKSCMKHAKCQSFLDIYVKNPQVCKLLIMRGVDEEKIIGRALVWTTEDGETYMDRIYTSYEYDQPLYKEYATKRNWLFYDKDPVGGLVVQLGNHKYEKYPYMDTFDLYDFENHRLLSEDSNGEVEVDDEMVTWPDENLYKLDDNDGGFTTGGMIWVESESDFFDRNDVVELYNGGFGLRRKSVWVPALDGWFYEDDYNIVYSEEEDEYIPTELACYSEHQSCWLSCENAVLVKTSDGDHDYISQNRINDTIQISMDDEDVNCFKEDVMMNPFTGEWVFRKLKVQVYFSLEDNQYLDKNEIGNKRWTDSKYMTMEELILDRISMEKLSEQDLYKYLKNDFTMDFKDKDTFFKLLPQPLSRIALQICYGRDNENRSKSFPDRLVGLVKCAIWKSPKMTSFDKLGLVSEKYLPKKDEVLKSDCFVDFLSKENLKSLESRSDYDGVMDSEFYRFYINLLMDIHKLIPFILKDKKMLKIFYKMKQ